MPNFKKSSGFKMHGTQFYGKSPFKKEKPTYRGPETFKGPGAYFKNTAKVIGSKIGGIFKKKK